MPITLCSSEVIFRDSFGLQIEVMNGLMSAQSLCYVMLGSEGSAIDENRDQREVCSYRARLQLTAGLNVFRYRYSSVYEVRFILFKQHERSLPVMNSCCHRSHSLQATLANQHQPHRMLLGCRPLTPPQLLALPQALQPRLHP